MKFTGAVSSRSSTGPDEGPPGETEIQNLNPGRKKQILEKTDWPDLAPGSLNLKVQNDVIFALEALTPLWIEDASAVIYPPPYDDLPKFRRAYWYYLADASKSHLGQEVLVRRAQCPVENTLELLAPVNIRKELALSDGDILKLDVR